MVKACFLSSFLVSYLNQMLQKLKRFFSETRQEFRHVNWPTRQEAVRLTAFVIVLSVGLAAFLGAFDYFFSYALRVFVLRR